ncbi:MAG: DUF72 domain-containing protein, partial [bacterium]
MLKAKRLLKSNAQIDQDFLLTRPSSIAYRIFVKEGVSPRGRPPKLPPSYTPKAIKQLTTFIKKIKLAERFALEPRNDEWFNDKMLDWAKEQNITWVSIDA